MSKPILYSFRRCPYAIRARIALALSQTKVELREILLKDKPQELLNISPKATVPILLLENGDVIDESLDIIQWALTQHNPEKIRLLTQLKNLDLALIKENDYQFKMLLDRYKYSDRFPEHHQIFYREQAEFFLLKLEIRLAQHKNLINNQLSIVDYAIFPFIRQFAYVDKTWFDKSQYQRLSNWLNELLKSELFNIVMHKYPQWKNKNNISFFPA